MRILNENSVRRLFPPHIYERGLKYFNNKRVIGLSYNKMKQSWFAEVQGSELYYVDVNMTNIDQGKIKSFCECPAFETYGLCKHLVAVLLSIVERESMPNSIANYHDAKKFLQGIINTNEPKNVLTERLPMKMEYYLQLERGNKVFIELRTGIDHCYVVRDIRQFLDAVLKGQAHYFTKKFSFLPEEHYYFQKDLDILTSLQSFMVAEELYTDLGYYGAAPYDKKQLLIPPLSFSSLLEKLLDRKCVVAVGNETYEASEIKYDQTPVQFTVTHNDEKEFLLQIDGIEHVHVFKQYEMAFANGVFYFPTNEQLSVLREAKTVGMFNRQLTIAKELADTFFSEALPVLRKAAPIEIAKQVSDEVAEYPLQAKLYMEENNEMIVGKLSYHYGIYEIDPFNDNLSSDVIIIRDIEKEQHIMGLIEQSNFHYNGKQLYIKLDDEEELYHFLYTILPILDEHVQLYLTSQIRSMIVDFDPLPSTSISVQTGTNLLEIGFDISGVNEAEVKEIIQAVIEKKRYYRLNSGALVSLEGEEYESLQSFFTNINVKKEDVHDGKVLLPVYRSTQIDDLLEGKKKYDPSFHKLLHQLKSPEEQVYEIPKNLQATLRDYQKTGYQWFKSLSHYQLGGILADDMGLGKTIQTIAFLLSEKSELPHLIVVPSSVVYNWRNEINRFAPHLTVAVISGTPEERLQIIESATEKDIWITSYGTLRQDIEKYQDLSFKVFILDEAQYIKNYTTKISKAVREIVAEKRFALSGTPIENSIDELWAIFQVVLPGLMPNLREFRQLEKEKIASLTRPFVLRRLKGDVLKELPEKIESVHVSELTKEQKELYVGYLQQLQEETTASMLAGSFQQNRMKILAGLTRLRQLCCHPSLFIENYDGESGKLNELMETLETMIDSGRRILIFSQFTSMHELIIAELKKKDIDYFYLHGATKAQERVEMTEAFNNGEKNVFLISLRAGGTGLNLTGADTVILYDLWWNPAVEDQAAGRAHRFGQKNVVQVIRFITEGTIEEKIYELQQKKRELIDQIIQPGETALSSLSEEDIRALLNI